MGEAWRKLIAQPHAITSIGLRDWTHVGQNEGPLVLPLGRPMTVVDDISALRAPVTPVSLDQNMDRK
jgi:hypothetical protein